MAVSLGNLTLYSVDELAEKLGVTKVTIRAYLREGKLIGKKVGGNWYISEDSLKQYFLTPNNKNFDEE